MKTQPPGTDPIFPTSGLWPPAERGGGYSTVKNADPTEENHDV